MYFIYLLNVCARDCTEIIRRGNGIEKVGRVMCFSFLVKGRFYFSLQSTCSLSTANIGQPAITDLMITF